MRNPKSNNRVLPMTILGLAFIFLLLANYWNAPGWLQALIALVGIGGALSIWWIEKTMP